MKKRKTARAVSGVRKRCAEGRDLILSASELKKITADSKAVFRKLADARRIEEASR